MNNDYMDNQLQSAISPTPPSGVLPNETMSDWHRRASKAQAPVFEAGSPEAVEYDNNVGELKKEMGASMGAMNGQREDPNALFDNTLRTSKNYSNANLDFAAFNAYNDVLEKNPAAKAQFMTDAETKRVAEQRQLTPQQVQARESLSVEGRPQFDAKQDQRIIDQAYPEQAEPSPKEVLDAQQNKMNKAGEPQGEPRAVPFANKTIDMMGNLDQQQKQKVFTDTVKASMARTRASSAGNTMYQNENYYKTIDGGLDGAQSRFDSGQATMEDLLALGKRKSRYGDFGKKKERVEDGEDRYGRTKYRTREVDVTEDEWVAQQNQRNSDRRGHWMQYADDLEQRGIRPEVAAKMSADRWMEEQELEREHGDKGGFETKDFELSDGTRIIGFRYGKDKGFQFRNHKSDSKVGIQETAQGWFETMPNGSLKHYSRKDGAMGSDGKLYDYKLKKDKDGEYETDDNGYRLYSRDKEGKLEPAFPDGITAWGMKEQGAKDAPSVGKVVGGYKFKGGDPAKQENWEQI